MAMLKGGKYDGRDSSWVPTEYLETDEGKAALKAGMPTEPETEETKTEETKTEETIDVEVEDNDGDGDVPPESKE